MIKLSEKINLSDYTLILPAVAVGNVGQLTVDLLISSVNMKKIGQIISTCFISILGADPYIKESVELCTATDIYCSVDKKIVAIQIRSPPVKGLQSFFESLRDFIVQQKISKVVILTSGWAHTRTDAQIRSEPMRYLASPSIARDSDTKFNEIHWLKLESTSNSVDNSDTLRIPGGGFALKLHQFLTNNDIPSIIVLKFCSEGDNVPDAVALAVYLDKWLKFGIVDSKGQVNTKFPHSWNLLFGNPAPTEIY